MIQKTIHCWLFLALLFCSAATPAQEHGGLLLLAHGVEPEPSQRSTLWNKNVAQLAEQLNEKFPTEVAFGMADPETLQAAVNRLEARNVSHIVVIPLFVSSHSPIIDNFRYLLGFQDSPARIPQRDSLDRIETNAKLAFGKAMDDHPLISKILLERALAVGTSPEKSTVILIAHGPNIEEENRRWLKDLATHAHYLHRQGRFREVRYLTHRTDAPATVKAKAREAFHAAVQEASHYGEAVVIPVLLSAGGIEGEIQNDLKGLSFHFGQPLLPHPNVQRWVEAQYYQLTGQSF